MAGWRLVDVFKETSCRIEFILFHLELASERVSEQGNLLLFTILSVHFLGISGTIDICLFTYLILAILGRVSR